MLINHLRFSIGEVKGNNCLHISIFAHVCFILQMIHRWKALILDNTGRGSILKFATPIFLKLIFRTNWAWPASKLSHAQLLNSKAFSWCIVLESVACTNFMPQPHSVFFIWVSPLHILNAPAYLTINYNIPNSDDSWVQKNGFLNNYWPHFFYSFNFFFFFQSLTPKPLFDQVL